MLIRIFLLSTLWVLSSGATADALKSLRDTLSEAPPPQALAGKMKVHAERQNPEEPSAEPDIARVEVSFTQNDRGIHLTYSPALLEQLKQERARQAEDPEADTPALEGMKNHVIATELQEFLNPNEALITVLNTYEFEGESEEDFEGRKLRKLRFSAGEERVSKEKRKHIKEYRETVDIWLTDSGEPVAKQKKIAYRGRAMLVVKFEGQRSALTRYKMRNNRLVVESFEFSEQSSGGPSDTDLKVTKQLVYNDTLAVAD